MEGYKILNNSWIQSNLDGQMMKLSSINQVKAQSVDYNGYKFAIDLYNGNEGYLRITFKNKTDFDNALNYLNKSIIRN
jgi:hypothetical protein